MERWQELDGLKKSMVSAVTGNLARKKSALQSKPAAINVRQARGRLRLEDSHLKSLLFSLVSGFNKYIAALKNSTVLLIKDLQANSPVTVLEKGYAFLFKEGTNAAVKSVKDIETGEETEIILSDGILFAEILDKINKKFGIEV